MRRRALPARALALGVLLGLAGAAPKAPPPAPKAAPKAVLVEGLTYTVDGLAIRGIVCRPDDRAGRPLLNLVHGGFDSPPDKATCRRFARAGYVVAASALRGQGGSEGRPEVCGREDEDVLALARLARERHRTDPARVAYVGVSLGGCVAVKAAARDPDARAVVTLLSPTDFAEQVDLLRRTRPDAVPRWEALLGKGDALRAKSAERSPLKALAALRAPLLTVAAGADPLIPVGQSCAVRDARRAAGRTVLEVRQTKDGAPSPLPDKPWRRCEDERPAATLPPLRGRDVLLIYTDLDHNSTPRLWSAAGQFVKDNIDPTPWERVLRLLRR